MMTHKFGIVYLVDFQIARNESSIDAAKAIGQNARLVIARGRCIRIIVSIYIKH